MWTPFAGTAIAKFDFVPTAEGQLGLSAGDVVVVTQATEGWYRGRLAADGKKKKGIFPASYVKLEEEPPPDATPSSGAPATNMTPTPAPPTPLASPGGTRWRMRRAGSRDNALYSKIDRCIKDWGTAMKRHLAVGNTTAYHHVKTQIAQLLEWRRQLVAAERGGGREDLYIVRESVMRLVEAASQIREGLIVPVTDADEVASEDNTGVVTLHALHKDTQERLEAGVRIALNVTQQLEMETAKGLHGAPRLGGRPRAAPPVESMRDRLHLMVDVRSVRAPGVSEPVDLYFSLWDDAGQKFMSEDFYVGVEHPSAGVGSTATRATRPSATAAMPRLEMGFGAAMAAASLGGDDGSGGSGTYSAVGGVRLKALFRHVSRRAVTRGSCYLVCTAFRRGPLQESQKARLGLAVYRRPLGVGVMRVPAVLPRLADGTPQRPPPLVLMRPKSGKNEDGRFADLHRTVVRELQAHTGQAVPASVVCTPKFQGIQVLLRGFSCPYGELLRPQSGYAPLLADVLAAGHVVQPLDGSGGMAVLQQAPVEDTPAAAPPASPEHLFVRLGGGEFAQDQKFAARNVQVRASLVAATGERLPCLFRGAGTTPGIEYRSSVYYHCNTPAFNETLCVRVPASPAVFERSHLLFTFFHASSTDNKTHAFSFAFLPLANAKGVAARDGTYRLYCYKPSKELEVAGVVPVGQYLHLVAAVVGAGVAAAPEGASPPDGSPIPERRQRDWFEVTTSLVSATKTSDEHMHTLQRWTAVDPSSLLLSLNNLASMGRSDAMRSVLQAFNAMFDVMGSYDSYFKAVPLAGSDLPSSVAVSSSCFRVLLNLLDRLASPWGLPEHSAVGPLLETYMHSFFWRPGLYKVLLPYIRAVLGDVASMEPAVEGAQRDLGPPKPTASPQRRAIIVAAFKSLSYLVWFTVASFLQEEQVVAARSPSPTTPGVSTARTLRLRSARHRAGTGAAGDVDEVVPGETLSRAQFKYELEAVLVGLQGAMAQLEPAAVLLPLQAHALNQYPAVCHHLSQVFEPRELGLAAHAFLRSIPLAYTSISVHKLVVVWELLHSGLFEDRDMRGAAFETVVRLVLAHLNRTDEERSMCVVIVTRLLELVEASPSPVDVWALSVTLRELATACRNLLTAAVVPPSPPPPAASASAPAATAAAATTTTPLPDRLSVRSRLRAPTVDDSPRTPQATPPQLQPLRLPTPPPPSSGRRSKRAGSTVEYDGNVPVTLPAALSAQLKDQHRQATVAFLGIIMQMPAGQLAQYLPAVCTSHGDVLAFLHQLLQVGIAILAHPPFPAQWLVLNMFCHTALIKLLGWVGTALAAGFRAPPAADAARHVWQAFFELGLCLLTSPTVSVEMLSGSRRQLVSERYGDKRPQVCAVLRSAWGADPSGWAPAPAEALANSVRLGLAGFLIGPCLELTYCACDPVAALGRDLYMDTLQAELEVAGGVSVVERRTIDAVDVLVAQGGPTLVVAAPSPAESPSLTAGSTLLMRLFAGGALEEGTAAALGHKELLADERVAAFLGQIQQLYAMLSSASQYPKTVAYEDERTAAALALIQYLQRTHRQDMYTKYVHFLADLHTSLGNTAESAHAQLLHANVLQWTDDILPAVRKASVEIFPTETSSKRLERLLLNALHKFDVAQCWEEAVRISGRLRFHYATVSYEYAKLSWLLKQEGDLFSKLAARHRFYPSYFCVAFFGKSFPKDVARQRFVYRGAQVERITDFERRLLDKWTFARKASPSEAVDPDTEEDVIKVSTLTPLVPCMVPLWYREPLQLPPTAPLDDPGPPTPVSTFLPVPTDKLAAVPLNIRQGLQHDGAHVFYQDRPFRKRDAKSGNDVLDTWVNRTVYVIEDAFPCTRRRSLVKATATMELNPVENAVVGLRNKNLQLYDAITAAEKCPDNGATQDFTMLMKGVVDAAVSGGVTNFVPVLNHEYEHTHPELLEVAADPDRGFVFDELRATLLDQFHLVTWGMAVHAVKCVAELRELHNFLVQRFKEMRTLLESLGVVPAEVEDTPADAVPEVPPGLPGLPPGGV